MDKKTVLVKTRIILDQKGCGLHLQFWKKTFWIFGYWYTWGTSSGSEIPQKNIRKINDNAIQNILWNALMKMRRRDNQ